MPRPRPGIQLTSSRLSFRLGATIVVHRPRFSRRGNPWSCARRRAGSRWLSAVWKSCGAAPRRGVAGAGSSGIERDARPRRRAWDRQDDAARVRGGRGAPTSTSFAHAVSSPRPSSVRGALRPLPALPRPARFPRAAAVMRRSARRSGSSSARPRGSRSEQERCRCSPRLQKTGRCCSSSTTRTGSIAAPPTRSPSRYDGLAPIALRRSFAMRPEEGRAFERRDLPELELEGLDDASSAALLGSAAPGTVPAEVEREIIALARGNPLALLELPKRIETLPDGAEPIRLGKQLERAFAARADELPDETRSALLVAAVTSTPDLEIVLSGTRAPRSHSCCARAGGVDRARVPRRREAGVPPSPRPLGALPRCRRGRAPPSSCGSGDGARRRRARRVASR